MNFEPERTLNRPVAYFIQRSTFLRLSTFGMQNLHAHMGVLILEKLATRIFAVLRIRKDTWSNLFLLPGNWFRNISTADEEDAKNCCLNIRLSAKMQIFLRL